MLIATVALGALLMAQTVPDGPVPSIRESGWDFPGLSALYAAYDPAQRPDDEQGGWTWAVGAKGSEVRARTQHLNRSVGAFWVTTVSMKAGSANISERVTVPQGVISYARTNEKPYCFLIIAVDLDLSAPGEPSFEYAIYDQDGDGRFEELEQVQVSDDSRWNPRPRLAAATEQPRQPILAISQKGWPVPAGQGALSVLPPAEEGWRKEGFDAFLKSRLLESWKVSVNGMETRGESILTGLDGGWVVTADLTARGVRVSHSLVHGGKFVTRYYDPGGRIFCLNFLVNPSSPFGIVGGLWPISFYDMDGDGKFEASISEREASKEWVPRSPKSMAVQK